MNWKYISSFLNILFLSSFVYSQSGTIRGFVYEKSTDEPIIYTSVYLDGTSVGTATDVNGFYTLSKVDPGKYTLIATGIGYDTAKVEVSVAAGQIITKNLYLSESSIQLGEIEIDFEAQEAKTEVKTSVVKVTPKQISKIPSIGGQAEIAQYIQVLPGVVFTGDQGGQLYIRGGSPIQNKVLMDGLIIYNPFHSIGLFSVFDSDLIRNADVYTGGFSAEYGGRISSVMDITMKDGNKKETHGQITASPFMSKLMLEGPLKKATDENSTSISYVLSAKEGYLDRTSSTLYSYADQNGLPFRFRDLYGKVSTSGPSGSRFNIFGFNFSDAVTNYQSIDSLGWSSSGAGANFLLLPAESPLLIEGKFGYSDFKTEMIESSGRNRNSLIGGFNAGLDFTYYLGDDDIKYGVEFLGFRTDFGYINGIGRIIEQRENTTELAGYFKYKKKINLLILDPSIRVHYYSSLSNTSIEPRLGIKYNINENLRWKFAGGWFSQNLISASSERDVVNLFQGYLSGSDRLPETFNGESLNGNKLQKSRHIITGFEYTFKKFTFNLEGYIKMFDQLSVLNRNKLYEDTPANFDKPDELKLDFTVETGKAYGADFNMKYENDRLYVWFVYSHGYVKRFDGVQEYWTHFDRRHNLNAVVSYELGKDKDWEINFRWNYGSAFPFTPTQGNIELLTFQDGINTDYTSANGQHEFILGDLNSRRLSDYHRLDINAKKSFEFENKSSLVLNLGVTNAYNRNNIFYIDRASYESVYQLPIMPNFGLNYKF